MRETDIQVERWGAEDRPKEGDLKGRLASEGVESYRWSNAPGDVYSSHRHTFHKTIYVVDGSISFGFPAIKKEIQLEAGDRLELPASIDHLTVVGPEGVICLEAHIEYVHSARFYALQ
jgi:quercetin dioxygenase-like cupin family protein